MSEVLPMLRPTIGARPVQHEGETLYVLHDTAGLSEAQLVVSSAVMLVASLFDGQRSILDVQDSYRLQTGGASVALEDVQSVLSALDESLFLVGKRFDAYYNKITKDFAESPVRKATSSGLAYSDDPHKLAVELDGMMESAPPPEIRIEGNSRHPRGVIAPHIDYVRGGAGYGQVYRELCRRPAPDTVIILGTAHQPMAGRVSVCDKDFGVPDGVVSVNRDLARELLSACLAVDGFENDVFAHHGEHTIELQAVWLRHIWGDSVRIVPVLVGSIYEYIAGGLSPDESVHDDQLAAFTVKLREIVAKDCGVMLLASADLAHVGPFFDDERDITAQFLEEVEEADRHYLRSLATGNAMAGLQSLARHGDRYRICGSGCIWAMTMALDGIEGKLLGYHQAASPEMLQAVTFASMMFG